MTSTRQQLEDRHGVVTALRHRRPLTEEGNASRLVDVHGDDVRYLPGAGWYVWDGTRWLHDVTGEATRRARALVRVLEAEADACENESAKKDLAKHAKQSGLRRSIEAMVALARSDERVLVEPEALDANPLLLNAPNGTIDLTTGRLRLHDRSDLITRRVAVAYDPDAPAPAWAAFLERVLPHPGLRDYVQRMAGAAAVGDNRDELLHVLQGGGANGKSKFCETVRVCLGDYAAATAVELFLADRSRGGARPELVRLQGVRLLTASETDERSRLNIALVKALTGGDAIAARVLYANEVVEFVPVFSPWLRTNHRPAIREQSEAVWRRVRLVPFSVTIERSERDPSLQGRLHAELPGVLAWIVAGARRYLADGLEPSSDVVAATDAYREEEDVLGAFVDDCCLTGPEYVTPARRLYGAWQEWAKAHGEEPGTATAFGLSLTAAGYPRGKDAKGRRARAGIALRGPLESEPDR